MAEHGQKRPDSGSADGGKHGEKRPGLSGWLARGIDVQAFYLRLGARGLSRERPLAALLVSSIFITMLLTLVAITGIGWALVASGIVTTELLTSVPVVTAVFFLVCTTLTFSVFVAVNAVVLRPLHRMLEALSELGAGNFDVRVKVPDNGQLQIRELTDFAEEFNACAERLSSVEVLRSGFIDDFSHEFKTPIVSIKGFAELLLEDDVTDEERREYAGIIARESGRLASMASDVLMLRQAESLDEVPDAAPVDVAEQVRRALLLVQEKWAGKDVALAVSVQEAMCAGSAALLERVWTNVLDNAFKFVPEGGAAEVTLTTGQEAPSGSRAGRPWVRLVVENDAPELGACAVDRVFERFYQADASHATQGCGLGLPLVARIAELHGGAAKAHVEDGRFRIEVELPSV